MDERLETWLNRLCRQKFLVYARTEWPGVEPAEVRKRLEEVGVEIVESHGVDWMHRCDLHNKDCPFRW